MTDANTILFVLKAKHSDPEPETCKGLIFRADVSSWVGSDSDVNFRERFRFVKRLSCPGCVRCDWLLEDLNNRIGDKWLKDTVVRPIEVTHGELFTLRATNMSRDWETGVIDEWDLEFVKLEENYEHSVS